MLVETHFVGDVTLDVRHNGIEASYMGAARLHRRLFIGWDLDELMDMGEEQLKQLITDGE